ncbi:alpha-amylase family glycosyl hydrolase [Vibrio genomosp. F10 str. 9ZC157]|uniref:Alpha-amylase n=1 Tax=Vibrio genomosp. F10 str. ZF-129 TaxID=1187848 RepID=A0A1E5BJ43_9VIBR|nr:alpha-amylase family glycosyl hydrolase [Vibrio genomosp. F10]OEE37471.1 alpha-amylase [Vibrio genomosp. F10 str. ZF-129]OEE93044.1 alpha-amylase [Vibrio genomosp. F10 str. 9ZC157]OEE93379.1 alpha-amylase [Vibrio genomosp. F10 str. 9ZD137]
MENVNYANVILHAFDWPYALVKERSEAIAKAGYKSVLISPPMKSLKQPNGTKWWQRYQPQDYRVIDNQLGNTHDFIDMLESLAKYDIYVYVDVVFNHMANESSIRNDLQYPSKKDLKHYQDNAEHYQSLRLFGDLSEPLFTQDDFIEAFGIEDWFDKWQVQNGRITGGPSDPGLPTLRDSERVIELQRQYLQALKDLGVKGFRIDAAKHITLKQLQKVWSEDMTQDVHIFGEIITDGGATREEYELFLEPYLKETRLGAYDFPLFQTVFDALQPNGSLKSLVDPYCFGQALSKRRAITFAITHDIPNNDVFENLVMSEDNEWLAYTYILGRDGGAPLIYSDLDTSQFKDSNGAPRWQDIWNDLRIIKRIDFYNRMHGQPMKKIEASEDVLIFGRGEEGVVVLNKSKRASTVEISVDGTWCDWLTGQVSEAKNNRLTLMINPCSSMMLVKHFSE